MAAKHKMTPMTYKEVEQAIAKRCPRRGVGIDNDGVYVKLDAIKFKTSGIAVYGSDLAVELFDTIMDRYSPTYYCRGVHFTSFDYDFAYRIYNRQFDSDPV